MSLGTNKATETPRFDLILRSHKDNAEGDGKIQFEDCDQKENLQFFKSPHKKF